MVWTRSLVVLSLTLEPVPYLDGVFLVLSTTIARDRA